MAFLENKALSFLHLSLLNYCYANHSIFDVWTQKLQCNRGIGAYVIQTEEILVLNGKIKTYKEGEFKEWENKKRKRGQKFHEETCANVSPFLLSSKAKSYIYFRKLY